MDKITSVFQKRYVDSGLMRGATVVVCRKDGVVYRKQFGDHGPSMVYDLHSLTKIITSVACLQLQERGHLDLDDPVSKHLPSFKKQRCTGDSSKCFPSLRKHVIITIRQCLNHTAGFTYPVHPKKLRTSLEDKELSKQERISLQNHVDDFMSETPLLFQPGTRFNYADGSNVIAHIVEIISGKPFDKYIHDNVFLPLGMHSTSFGILPGDA
eukprot:gnl/MRDRNA2_/MRDRNA2_15836_c0_seq1.p1 gnl/MRDRNA2_/MRDRNA2_15836_c0~~gnl/MRDRNA2_/MRDRNA2_15836_c0_seq1.p1  ORF type:complete len:211 (+),score=29.61 gnl/MRDRNA2_/MRDRNA2_15836_c0_seq1:111-743(+)